MAVLGAADGLVKSDPFIFLYISGYSILSPFSEFGLGCSTKTKRGLYTRF